MKFAIALSTLLCGSVTASLQPFGSPSQPSLSRRQDYSYAPPAAGDNSNSTVPMTTDSSTSTSVDAASSTDSLFSTNPIATPTATDSISTAAATNLVSLDTLISASISTHAAPSTPTSWASPVSNVTSTPTTPTLNATSNIDLVVLNLAFTLERLEATFYERGLANFSRSDWKNAGYSIGQTEIIIEEITRIQGDESVHASTLVETIVSLGEVPFVGCTFNFDAVLQDPFTFLSTARVLEAVGVSAYLGAAHLLSKEALLTAAGSILTIEARHSAFLNVLAGGSFAPQPFDIALSPPQVLSLAGSFLVGCKAEDLGLTANQPLVATDSVSKSSSFVIGSKIEFTSTVAISSNQYCQMLVGGAATALVFPTDLCVVPDHVEGPVAVFVTSSNTPLASDLVAQDVTIIVAGPALIFVDSRKYGIGRMFRNKKHQSHGSRHGMNRKGSHHDDHKAYEIVIIDDRTGHRYHDSPNNVVNNIAIDSNNSETTIA